jgi:hypothetical protein
MNDFADKIKKFKEKAQNRVRGFIVEFVQNLNEDIIRGTPVDTGFLRANWIVSLNAPVEFTSGTEEFLPIFKQDNTFILSRYKDGDTIYLTNNTKYGPYVEYGTSRMAPRAMVRNALNRANLHAQTALATVQRRYA